MNGDPQTYGSWFHKHEQFGLSLAVGALEAATRHGLPVLEVASQMASLHSEVKRLSGDDQAALRRVALCFCRESLVAAETAQTMRQETSERAALARARRQGFWAKHSA
jgi:hypothetical protein